MKRLITILFLIFSVSSFAQINVQRTTTTTPNDRYLHANNLFTLPILSDTITFTGSNGLDSLGSEIYVKSGTNKGLWLRDTISTGGHIWVKQNIAGGSTVSVYQDSLLVICNLNSCDTINTHIVINNWRIEGDTSIIVCPASGSCDTIIINPTTFNKAFVDSTKISVSTDDSGIDTSYYYIQGSKFFGGLINRGIVDTIAAQLPNYFDSIRPHYTILKTLQADGIIQPGYVTWTGQGLIFNITGATYVIGGVQYTSPPRLDTLSPADPTNPRTDLFIVNTLGQSGHVTGTPSSSPISPQPIIGSQLALTTITINAGDTIPAGVTLTTIYNEPPVGWEIGTQASPITANFYNTDNPYNGIKDLYISKYQSGAQFFFIDSPFIRNTPTTDGLISFWIYLNGALPAANNLYLEFWSFDTLTGKNLLINSDYGFNRNDSNQYQHIVIPFSKVSWQNSALFTSLIFTLTGNDTSGAKGLYIDYMQLQQGINNITPPTYYSNKADSAGTYKINDSTYVTKTWVKGIGFVVGDTIHIHASGGGTGNTNSNVGSGYRLAIPNTNNIKTLTGGYAMLLDSVTTNQINLKVDSAALSLKYLRIADTAAMLSPYIPKNGITQGTNVTITGSGTSGSPYVINAVASAQVTADTLNIATGGQTVIPFSQTPANKEDCIVTIWGVVEDPALYSITAGVGITLITGSDAGDKIRIHRIK